MITEEVIDCMEKIHNLANEIMFSKQADHPAILVGACAMAAGSVGTLCSLPKEDFLEHVMAMVGQAWDRQLEAQVEHAKDHGPLQ